ncbi:MAG TPA: glycosyl hydrolase family 28 protein [Armatimonadota bacterium]|nr:glycosyl hydrolase family 28 protein [Armatimonadota bacterium]
MSQLITYPAPAGEAVTEYQVTVNGTPVDVYQAQTQHHDKQYFFATFDFTGLIEIRVTSAASLQAVEVLPQQAGMTHRLMEDGALSLTADRPFRISVERDGENSPLLLFGNAIEHNTPSPGDPGVVYFGPGVHAPGKITLGSNQTLYIAGGAVVKGGIEAHGKNIRILGRGILDGSEWGHFAGPTTFMIDLQNCRNVVVQDIILRGSWGFTLVPCGCDGVIIDNVKLCGSRVDNDDGIDPINSSNVTIRDCFLRTDDDCIAIKGLAAYGNKACENITVEHCCFWTDRANIFRIGYESDAAAMRNITARNIDVLHFGADDRPAEAYWSTWVFCLQPSNNMPMTNLLFEDFRLNATGENNNLIKILPMYCNGIAWQGGQIVIGEEYAQPGQCVCNAIFRNIHLTGKATTLPGRIYIAGADAEHTVSDIVLENVTRFGQPVKAGSPDVFIGEYTSDIVFR